MQLKNLVVSSFLALGAAAAGTNSSMVAGTLLNRFAELDIGYQNSVYQLNHLAQGTNKTTSDDVISTLNQTITSGAKDLSSSQPSGVLPDAIQLILCQAAHSVHLNVIAVCNGLVDNAAEFDKDQRYTLQEVITEMNDQSGGFLINVARQSLPVCLSTVQTDDKAIYNAVIAASYALDPSEA